MSDKKISEMEGSELREFLGIKSVADKDMDAFDAFDANHFGRDYHSADNRRKWLIDRLTTSVFAGGAEDVSYITDAIMDDDDRMSIADELINLETYKQIWKDIEYDVPDSYSGIDAYVEASKIEFVANLKGRFASDDDIGRCFSS